ncbi:uncharacterized protein B0T15DRAFT_530366 [Chaetomium strumarium]|uniref:Uncharacterized protein n=1 Tax=Chaetomium strumarium TaxID=1170767 RepID=A0AAJ0GX60_9PEZI|nr:hypothetical protein B0T15DRAFT_530366 [Chaetomium strumarium]
MDSSPLIKAHDHARAAAIATQTSNTTVAINEHAQAAGEFANASKTTSSIEALRILGLLERHHRRLSERLKLPIAGCTSRTILWDDIPIPEEDEKEEDEKEAAAQNDSKAAQTLKEAPAAEQVPLAKPVPRISHNRYPGRNLSSSIATNLASARGIKASYSTQPLTPSVSNDQAPGSLEVHPRRERKEGVTTGKAPELSRKPSGVPPAIREDTASKPSKSEPASPVPSDDGFSRFYNTFGSLFNRLPLPLVFSGLPLISEEATTPAPTAPTPEPPHRKPPRNTRHSTSAAEPDLTKIYSRATLRSLERDSHGANDSFYVVPTSGHTASYASILNHERKEKRRMAASSIHSGGNDDNNNNNNNVEMEAEDDDFVDARESQQGSAAPLSPTFRKRRLGGKSQSRSTEKELRNVIEELQLENASLKDVLDKLSKRLHAFELNSQSSHMALAQSLRLQRPDSPTTPGLATTSTSSGVAAAVTGEAALRRRNRELEEQLGEMVKRMQSLEKDHLKLQLTVEKYRERWEQLKASAKARRAARGDASDGESRR